MTKPDPRVEELLQKAVSAEDAEKGVAVCYDALGLALKLDCAAGQNRALYALGEYANTAGDHFQAIKCFNASLRLSVLLGDQIQQGRCLRRLGDSEFFINNFNLAMRYYLRALKIFEWDAEENLSQGSRLHSGHLMATIGNVLRATGDLQTALDYYTRCRDIYQVTEFTAGIPGILYNMGNIYQSTGEREEALLAFRTALEEAEKNSDKYLSSLANASIGSIFMETEDLDSAGRYFSRSLTISESMGRKRGILSVTVKIITLERLRGNLEKSLELVLRAEKLAEQVSDRKSLAEVLKEKTLILKGMRKYKKALDTSLVFQKLSEELHSEKRMRELDVLRIRYETEKTDRQISRLKRERAIQRRMIAGAVSGFLITGFSFLSVYRSMSLRTRANKELESKNIELAGAYSRVEKLSRTDTLTNLANRRAMMELLALEDTRSTRSGRTYGLIIADIDGFKQVNDSFGHACGDEVLVQLSEAFKLELRAQDVPARWGGEEFLFLLPDTTLAGAGKVAEKIRVCVDSTIFKWKKHRVQLTMTFGVAEGGSVPFDKVILAADRALYSGKRKGKNIVICSD